MPLAAGAFGVKVVKAVAPCANCQRVGKDRCQIHRKMWEKTEAHGLPFDLKRHLQNTQALQAVAGAREFERSVTSLERQRDVASIVNGMLKFGADEAVQKAACRSLLNLTPSVEGDEYQKIRSQDGEAWAQMQREYRAMASAGVIDVVCRAISAHSAEVAYAGCRILKLLAHDDENQRKIGAQVVQAHAHMSHANICALAIAHTHTHTYTRT